MSINSFTYGVGDKIRLKHWPVNEWVKVEWVGDRCFAGIKQNFNRKAYQNTDWASWIKYGAEQ